MKYVAIFFFLSLCLSEPSSALEKPPWVSHTPADTAKEFFFVGRSPFVETEFEGIKMASKDAKEQLIRQEFGTEVRLDTTQSDTLKDVTLDSKLSEISDQILLKGFRQIQVFSEGTDGKLTVWALYSVLKSEIKGEKKRIAALQAMKPTVLDRAGDVKMITSMPSKEFNNGGKHKLKKGLKKSVVIEMFGAPDEVGNYAGTVTDFKYSSPEYCHKNFGGNHRCWVYFSESGRVKYWSDFQAEYTTDLDDIPETRQVALNKKLVRPKARSVAVGPASYDALPPGAIPAEEFERLVNTFTENKANLIILDKEFFVQREGIPGIRYHYLPTEVRSGEQFGFIVKFQGQDRKVGLTVKLIVPNSPRNFPCSQCGRDELKILDDHTVVVNKLLNTRQSHTGFYWGIGPSDPKGKYELSYFLDGQFVDSYKFEAK